MKPEHIQILVNMDVCLTPDCMEDDEPDAVFLRLVNHGRYVDAPVNGLYKKGNEWFIETQFYDGLSLSELRTDQIQVCKVVQDWWRSDEAT